MSFGLCMQATEEYTTAHALLNRMWNRQFADVWQILGNPSWSPPCRVLASAIERTLRDRVLDLISKSYTTIYLKNAAALAGTSEADMVTGTCCQAACLQSC